MSEKSEKEEKQGDEDKAGPSKKRSRAESEDASQDIRLDHPDRQIGPYGEYDEENLSCPICCEIFFNPTALPCGHVFCRHCLRQVLQTEGNSRKECPVCRNSHHLSPHSTLGPIKLVETAVSTLHPRAYSERTKECKEVDERLEQAAADMRRRREEERSAGRGAPSLAALTSIAASAEGLFGGHRDVLESILRRSRQRDEERLPEQEERLRRQEREERLTRQEREERLTRGTAQRVEQAAGILQERQRMRELEWVALERRWREREQAMQQNEQQTRQMRQEHERRQRRRLMDADMDVDRFLDSTRGWNPGRLEQGGEGRRANTRPVADEGDPYDDIPFALLARRSSRIRAPIQPPPQPSLMHGPGIPLLPGIPPLPFEAGSSMVPVSGLEVGRRGGEPRPSGGPGGDLSQDPRRENWRRMLRESMMQSLTERRIRRQTQDGTGDDPTERLPRPSSHETTTTDLPRPSSHKTTDLPRPSSHKTTTTGDDPTERLPRPSSHKTPTTEAASISRGPAATGSMNRQDGEGAARPTRIVIRRVIPSPIPPREEQAARATVPPEPEEVIDLASDTSEDV